jgi:hypothetical protein
MSGQIAYLAREIQRQEQLEEAARARLVAHAPRPARRLRAPGTRLRRAVLVLAAAPSLEPVARARAGIA